MEIGFLGKQQKLLYEVSHLQVQADWFLYKLSNSRLKNYKLCFSLHFGYFVLARSLTTSIIQKGVVSLRSRFDPAAKCLRSSVRIEN